MPKKKGGIEIVNTFEDQTPPQTPPIENTPKADYYTHLRTQENTEQLVSRTQHEKKKKKKK
ncbi:hypothetical protein HpBGD65_15030 [Helicobacter pylori]